jgi:hypothetical protein
MKKSTTVSSGRYAPIDLVLTDCQEPEDGECGKEEVSPSMIEIGEHHWRYQTDDTGSQHCIA